MSVLGEDGRTKHWGVWMNIEVDSSVGNFNRLVRLYMDKWSGIGAVLQNNYNIENNNSSAK